MAKTRGKGATAATAEPGAQDSSIYRLPVGVSTPPKLFVLPTRASSKARVVSLAHPRTSKPARYLVCPESGFFEITKFAAGKADTRSWLIESAAALEAQGGDKTRPPAQVSKEPDLYVATAFDALFITLPALVQTAGTARSDQKKRMFLSLDDHLDSLGESFPNLPEILRWKRIRELLESRMTTICDTVAAADETMFKLNETKLLEEILSKARGTSDVPLPASLEQKFVKKCLEAPVMSIRSTAVRGTAVELEASEGTATPQTELSESQTSISTVESAASSVSTAPTAATSVSVDSVSVEINEEVVVAAQASEDIIALQRLEVAFNFICSRYIPPILAGRLKELLAAKRLVNFAPLHEYRTKLEELRQDSLNARSLSGYSRKRPFDEEDEERAEKRRKKEEEERRLKANESRGVRELKKVNVSGMKKLSAFFTKK